MVDDEKTGGGIGPDAESSRNTTQDDGALFTGAPSPFPPTQENPGEEPLKQDIAKILEESKLPVRRGASSESSRGHTVEIPTALGASTLDIRETPEEPPHEERTPSPVSAVHTLKQDLQEVVRSQKISYVKAAALEEEKRAKMPAEPVEPSRRMPRSRTLGVVFSIFLLIFLGAAALGGVYFVATQRAPLPQDTAQQSFVFAEQSAGIPMDGSDPAALKAQIAQMRLSSQASLGSITRVVPLSGTQPSSLSVFFEAIGAQPPADLMRALGQDFFFGLHTVDENAPVLVIPVQSFDRAFAGMLQWESTLNSDLSPIFTPLPKLTTGADGIPTERTFVDVVRNNYDQRALYDDSGTIQLYYSFPTRSFLVIAESPYTFMEIINRLQAGRQL